MAATPDEARVMTVKELGWARWRACAAAVAWFLVAFSGLVDILQQAGIVTGGGDSPWGHWLVDFAINVVAVVYGTWFALRNWKAEGRLRTTLHHVRSARASGVKVG